MPTLKRILVDELQVGMIIIRSDKPGVIFDEYGIPLSSIDKIKYLKDNGVSSIFIWSKDEEANKEVVKKRASTEIVSTEKSNEPVKQKIIEPKDIVINSEHISNGSMDTVKSVTVSDEQLISTGQILVANKILQRSQEVISASLNNIKKGEKIHVSALNNVIGEMVEATILYPGVFTNVARLEAMGDAEYTHGLNVAILSISIGQTMGLTGNALIKLGIAGLLHDVGKSRIPDKLLQKRGRLTDQEFHVLSKHPEWSEQILRKSPDISEDILSIVLHHHERADGSGYPSQLSTRYLSKLDVIVGIAEDYDTMMGGGIEAYPVLHSCEAVRRIYSGMGTKFPEEYVKAFLKTIGIFPVGSFIRLSNNDIAIVAELNKNNPMQPKVVVIKNNDIKTVAFLNLHNTDIKIVAPISAKDYAFDPKIILADFIEQTIEAE